MPKLTDSQLVILSAAARRQDGTVLPLPKSLKVNKAAVATVLKSLLKKGPFAERPAAADEAQVTRWLRLAFLSPTLVRQIRRALIRLDRIRIDRTHIVGSIDPVNPVYGYKVEQIHGR